MAKIIGFSSGFEQKWYIYVDPSDVHWYVRREKATVFSGEKIEMDNLCEKFLNKTKLFTNRKVFTEEW